MGNGGIHNRNAAIEYARNLARKTFNNAGKSEQKSITAELEKDSSYKALALWVICGLAGLLLYLFGILGGYLAILLVLPLSLAIVQRIRAKRHIDVTREKQVKMHMMAKGDDRYWGRGDDRYWGRGIGEND